MKNIGIFYGSATGTTEQVAKDLAKILGVDSADVHNVAEVSPTQLAEYRTMVLGSSTWGSGELEDDWYDLADSVRALDLSGHRVAIFGCGDESMSDTFCDAVGILYDKFKDTGAEMIGSYPADGYNFSHSAAQRGNQMVGLVLDQVNHPEWTARRLADWAKAIDE